MKKRKWVMSTQLSDAIAFPWDNHHTFVCSSTSCYFPISSQTIKNTLLTSSMTFLNETGIFFLLHHGEEYNDYWWSLVPMPWFVQRQQQQFYPSLFLHHQCRFNTVNKANVLLLLLLLLNCFELIGPERVLGSPRSTIKNHYHT